MTGASTDWAEAQTGSPTALVDSAMSGGPGQTYVSYRVADLPFEERQKALKAFWQAPWSNFKEGDYIDATDTVSKWCLA